MESFYSLADFDKDHDRWAATGRHGAAAEEFFYFYTKRDEHSGRLRPAVELTSEIAQQYHHHLAGLVTVDAVPLAVHGRIQKAELADFAAKLTDLYTTVEQA